ARSLKEASRVVLVFALDGVPQLGEALDDRLDRGRGVTGVPEEELRREIRRRVRETRRVAESRTRGAEEGLRLSARDRERRRGRQGMAADDAGTCRCTRGVVRDRSLE